MKLGIQELKLELPADLLNTSITKLNKLKLHLNKLATSSGTNSKSFNYAYSSLQTAIKNNSRLEDSIHNSIGVRALAVSLQSNLKKQIILTPEIFKKVDQIKKNPSTLFIESVNQHYLLMFDKLSNLETVEKWLINALNKKIN